MNAFVAALAFFASTAPLAAAPALKVVAFDIEPFELASTQELRALLEQDSAALRHALVGKGLAVVDLKPQAAEIAAHAPLSQCGGCENAIARALGADLAVTTTVQEIEYPIDYVAASVKDAATGHVLRKAVVSIDGLSEEDWKRGVTTLVEDRLLARPLPADADALRAMVAKLPVPPE